MVNDFRPFKAALTKLSTQAGTIERANDPSGDPTRAIERKRRIDTAYEVYLGLYRSLFLLPGHPVKEALGSTTREDFSPTFETAPRRRANWRLGP